MRRATISLLATFALAGCAGRDGSYTAAVDLVAIAAAGDSLIVVERNRHRAYAFEVPSFEPTSFELPTEIAGAWPRHRADRVAGELLVLARGAEGGSASKLLAIRDQAMQAPELVECRLSRSWTTLEQSASGDHALLYSTGEEHQDAFTGTSTIGFVTLDDCLSGRSHVVGERTVRSLAQPIHGVVIDDQSATPVVAALRFDTHVQVVQLDDAQCQLRIQPAGAAARDAFRPVDVALLEGWIAVRLEAAREVLVVHWDLAAATACSPGSGPRVEQLVDAGAAPTDMLLLKVGSQPHLVTLAPSMSSPGTSLLVDFDLEAGKRTQLPLDFEATQLDLIEGHSDRVLVSAPVAGDAALAVVTLETRPALETGSPLRLPQGFARVLGAARCGQGAPSLALAYAQGGGGLLDPETSDVASFAPHSVFQQGVLDAESATIWGVRLDEQGIAFADLDDCGSVGALPLHAPVETLLAVDGAQADTRYLVVLHPSIVGDATLVRSAKGTEPRIEAHHQLFLARALTGSTP